MSDVTREEFEALKERVSELEQAGITDAPDYTGGVGLDPRDHAVLDYMSENGRRSKRSLVRLYIQLTDIQDRSKAKRRAKNLEQTEEYENL